MLNYAARSLNGQLSAEYIMCTQKGAFLDRLFKGCQLPKSARRPMQLAPAENMKVQVRNGFAGEEPVVYNNPKPVFKPAFFRDFRHGEHEVREYLGVFLFRFGNPRNGFYRE